MRHTFFSPAIVLVSSILFFSNAMFSQSPSNPTSGQQLAAGSAAAQTSESQRPAKKKTNKVWTNEDVGGLTGSVSVVGDSATREKNRKIEQAEKSPENSKDAAWYRTQLAPLHSQLESVERQIQKLKNFKGSNASPEGGIQYGGRYNMTPVEQQMKQLEAKKKSLQSNIDDLESDARHHGIEPGELH